MSEAKEDNVVQQDQGNESTGKAVGELSAELAGSEGRAEAVRSRVDSEGRLAEATLEEDDDVLTAICNDSGIEIVSLVKGNIDEANDQDSIVTKTGNLPEELILIAKPEYQIKHIEKTEQVVSNATGSDSKIKTCDLDDNQIVEQNLHRNEETIPAENQGGKVESVGDKDLDEIAALQNERLQLSDSKETESPFVFPTPEAKTDISTPQDPLTKLLDPSTKRLNRSTKPPSRLPSKPRSQTQSTESLHRAVDPKKRGDPSTKPATQLPSKTWSPNHSTESLQLASRIPRSSTHLSRSVSMVTPRVTSPLPAKGDNKTPVRRPVQKIPHLIHSQRRPGAVLKRSVSVQVIKKKSTEMAEGMTLVLAVPVTHSTQSVSRSSGELRQKFVISPYQEEHVLAATCPISGITRHIKIIL